MGGHCATDTSTPFKNPAIREELLTLLLDSAGTGAWVWDLPTSRVHWSPHVHTIFRVENFDGRLETFHKLIHPADFDRCLAEVTHALTTRTIFRTSFRAILPDGDIRLVGNIGKARYDSDGTATMFIGTVCDLTIDGLSPGFAEGSGDGLPATATTIAPETINTIRMLRDELRFNVETGHQDSQHRVETKIVEFLLNRLAEPRKAHRLAEDLIHRFGSMAGVINAPPSALKTVDGIIDEHVALFELVQWSTLAMLNPTSEPAKFTTEAALISYLRAAQAYQATEQLRVIFMDRARHIISNDLMQKGTVDHTPVYVREIVKRALEVSASSLVLVHNHPSGDPMPSQSDIAMTRAIIDVARGLGITIDDHIILGRHGHVSMKAMRLI